VRRSHGASAGESWASMSTSTGAGRLLPGYAARIG
jgi:hypothetical protein